MLGYKRALFSTKPNVTALCSLSKRDTTDYTNWKTLKDSNPRLGLSLAKSVPELRMVSVQWGPRREVGMAAQKGTVQRLKAQGLGSIGNVASWL